VAAGATPTRPLWILAAGWPGRSGVLKNPVGVQVGWPTLEEQAKTGPVAWEIAASFSVKQGFGTFLILGKPAHMPFPSLDKTFSTGPFVRVSWWTAIPVILDKCPGHHAKWLER
jgi:hypothetical protein